MATTKATLLGHRSATSFSDLTLSGDLTVNGTTTTLDTAVQSVDKLEIGANSDDYGAQISQAGTGAGLKINSSSTGHIMQLQDNGTDVMVVKDGGNVGIGTNNPSPGLGGSDVTLEIEGATSPSLTINDTGQAEKYSLYADSNDFKIGYGTTILATFQNDGKVGIGTASPGMPLHVYSAENDLMHLQSTDQDALFKLSDSGGHFQINTANNNTSLGVNGRGEMLRFAGTTGIVLNEDGLDQDFRVESDINANAFFLNGANGYIGIGTHDTGGSMVKVKGHSGVSGWVTTDATDSSSLAGVRMQSAGANKWWIYNNPGAGPHRLIIADAGDNSGVYLPQDTASWSAISDERMKTDWENFSDALNKINTLTKIGTFRKINPISGEYVNDDPNVTQTGLSAQEVQKILPNSINKGRRNPELYPDDETEYLGMSYQDIFVLGIKAIQELSAKVTALENATN